MWTIGWCCAVSTFSRTLLSFYGGTIQLEEVTNHQFLGFRLNAADRTVTYIQPDKAWSIRNRFRQVAGPTEFQASYPERPSLYSMLGLPAADQVNCRNFVDCT